MKDSPNCAVSLDICSSTVMVKSSGFLSLSFISSVSSFWLNFVSSICKASLICFLRFSSARDMAF